MELFLNDKLGKISYEIDQANNDHKILILAHGAGAGMDHPFLRELGEKISSLGINVLRFNFPYKEKGKKVPGSPKHSIETWKCMVQEVKKRYPGAFIFISGKSYGGRMAAHYLHENEAAFIGGIIYFGFPLHAPGRDSKERANHLKELSIPQLFIQGTRDKLANIELINEVIEELQYAKLVEITSGDHSFNVPKSIASKEEIMMKLAQECVDWIEGSN